MRKQYAVLFLAVILSVFAVGCGSGSGNAPVPAPFIAPPVAPVVQTHAATGLTDTSATLNGEVISADWSDVNLTGGVWFQWQLVGGSNWNTEMLGRVRGPVTKALTGLLPAHRYVYYLQSQNGTAQSTSEVEYFSTLSTTPTTVPTEPIPVTPTEPQPITPTANSVQTRQADNATPTSVDLHGWIGLDWSRYSVGAAYLQVSSDVSLDDNYSVWASYYLGRPVGEFARTIVNLVPGTAYKYRILAILGQTAAFVPTGASLRFTTATQSGGSAAAPQFAPSAKAGATIALPGMNSVLVQTRGYTNLGDSSATIYGYVDVPKNVEQPVYSWFQISQDGESWECAGYCGSTNADKTVSIDVPYLVPSTHYWYRVAAGMDKDNITYGYPREFTTLTTSDYGQQVVQNLSDLADGLIMNTTYVRQTLNDARGNGLHPKLIAQFQDNLTNLYRLAEELMGAVNGVAMNSQSVSISEELGKRIEKGLFGARTLMSDANGYLEDAYLAEFQNQHSTTFGVVPPEPYTGKAGSAQSKSAELLAEILSYTGKANKALVKAGVAPRAGAEYPESPESTFDYNEVVILMCDGVDAIMSRAREATWQGQNGWDYSYAVYLASRVFTGSRLIHDFINLPDIRPSVRSDVLERASNLDKNVKLFRTDFRDFETRQGAQLANSWRQCGAYVWTRYVEGDSNYGGLGKAGK